MPVLLIMPDPSRLIPFLSLSRPQIAVIVVVAVLIGGGALLWMQFFQTYHLETVQERALYRCGNRGMRELKTMVRKVEPRVVVTLIDDEELADPTKAQFKQEIEYLASQSIRCERIAIPLGGWPTTADVQKFLALFSSKETQPVLVHCAQGVRRTGMLVAAYQMSLQGYDKARAKAELISFGHSRRTVRDIEVFIDEMYDPATRQVMGTRPLGKE